MSARFRLAVFLVPTHTHKPQFEVLCLSHPVSPHLQRGRRAFGAGVGVGLHWLRPAAAFCFVGF